MTARGWMMEWSFRKLTALLVTYPKVWKGKGDIPSGSFGYSDGEEGLATFTECSAFSDEAKSVKVHVGAADDGYEAFPSADEVVIDDVPLETSKC